MKEQLLHILDDTACLTRKQMKDYLAGTMLPEEIHAAESHIASCPLCSMALEGFEAHSEEALAAIASLNSGFLKEHFDAITPQIHLNSLSPSTTVSGSRPKKRARIVSFTRLLGVAAMALLAIGAFWYYQYNQEQKSSGLIAQRETAPAPISAAAPPATVRIADSILLQPTTASRTNGAALDEPTPIIKEKLNPEAPDEAAKKKEVIAGKMQAAETEKAAPPEAASAPSVKPGSAPVVVSAQRYAKPLVDFKSPSSPGSKTTSKSEAQRSSALNEADMAGVTTQSNQSRNGNGLSLGGARSGNTTYIVDGAVVKDKEEQDDLRRGDENFGAGKYSAALKNYKSGMGSADRSRKSMASVMAARCYINLGEKAKATELLERVVNEGSGPQRRQARRLLRGLRKEGDN